MRKINVNFKQCNDQMVINYVQTEKRSTCRQLHVCIFKRYVPTDISESDTFT